MGLYPRPVRGESISLFRELVNSSEADWALLISWLVTAFRPGYPFPILVIHGEQGSAKSTLSKMLRELIDPNAAPLRSEQRDERDLMLAATNSWIVRSITCRGFPHGSPTRLAGSRRAEASRRAHSTRTMRRRFSPRRARLSSTASRSCDTGRPARPLRHH